jgi:hypothetical protein
MNIELAAQDAGTARVISKAALTPRRPQASSSRSRQRLPRAMSDLHCILRMFRSWTVRVAALKAASKANGDFSIVAPGGQVQKLFRLTAMDRVFGIFRNAQRGLASTQAGLTVMPRFIRRLAVGYPSMG